MPRGNGFRTPVRSGRSSPKVAMGLGAGAALGGEFAAGGSLLAGARGQRLDGGTGAGHGGRSFAAGRSWGATVWSRPRRNLTLRQDTDGLFNASPRLGEGGVQGRGSRASGPWRIGSGPPRALRGVESFLAFFL